MRHAAILAGLLLACAPLAGQKTSGPKKPADKGSQTAASAPASSAPASALDERMLHLPARSIGPALMGGRISEIAVDPRDPFTYYVAHGTGGVMKTSNAGTTFSAIFEKEPVASTGAVAVSPADSKVVWVGTGEANDRNSSGWGNGVYRSTDAGGTFTNVGLPASRAIARIVAHPRSSDVAYVAAMGDLWMPGGERGLFKTTDGGKSWKAVLSAPRPFDDRVGCGDVVMDPSSPETLYAALYARRRTPWSFVQGPDATEGKDLGGIFKTTDGGATWRKLEKGLPGRTARIGLDLARSSPNVVMAIVQTDEGGQNPIRDNVSKRGGVFRSEDGGETFTRQSPLNPRPFYFSQIRVDPRNPARVYVLGMALHASEDGGVTWREDLFQKVHPDCHALLIFPEELSGETKACRRLLLGTDGGLYESHEAGKTWKHLTNMATGEFYRITLDGSSPYRIAGGLQDNLSWVGPSQTFTKDGIADGDWHNLGGGDGFSCVFDSEDRDVVYAESQRGDLFRVNLRNGERKDLRPEPAEGFPDFRYHWNAPLIGSRHHKDTLYLGGNRVFRLTRKGEEWTPISPDLTTKDPEKTTSAGSGAETYGVVYTLAESPKQAGVLWAGTDDGKLWRTADEGKTWTDLTSSLPAAVKGQWISRVEASGHDASVAYLAVDAHRTGVFTPLAYRTADGGKTWQSLAGNLPADGPVKVVREDPRSPSVLYAGTELALFVSLDQGRSWTRFGQLPTVAVDDLAVHPTEHDLVVATHGRSLYIVDDVSPLAALTAEVRSKDAYLFPPRPATARYLHPGWEDMAGKGHFRGKNPPEGALITFWLKEASVEEVKIKVTSPLGHPVAELKTRGIAGLNRVSWDLKRGKDFVAEYGGITKDRFVKAGTYELSLTSGKAKATERLEVKVMEGLESY